MKRLRNTTAILLLAAVGAAGVAGAQITLPPVPGVPLPQPQLPGLPGTISDTLRVAESVPLADLRRLRVRELLRSERKTVELDPNGEPILRRQIGALSPSPEALARARDAGFTILREDLLGALGIRLVILQAPDGMSTRRALKRMRALDPGGSYDFHHLYVESGVVMPAGAGQAEPAAPAATNPAPAAGARIGLIDSGVDGAHPALTGVKIHRYGCAGDSPPAVHGTAVASLMAGQTEGFRGALAGAELYAADVFCGKAGGSVAMLALALDWMASRQVAVVNISLVGAKSLLLTGLVRTMGARGHLLVASVGNDGPASPPLYPSAYPEVIGVTGVDPQEKVLAEACRGKHVAFAAPGADMLAAAPGGGWNAVRGTSFASPIVAGLLARILQKPDPLAARAAVASLAEQARDLGPKGVDSTYGRGLVGASYRVAARVEPAK